MDHPRVPPHLEEFIPYRMSVLTNTVSRAIARIYAERFDITVAEWRVMAVFGMAADLSANEVSARTAIGQSRGRSCILMNVHSVLLGNR